MRSMEVPGRTTAADSRLPCIRKARIRFPIVQRTTLGTSRQRRSRRFSSVPVTTGRTGVFGATRVSMSGGYVDSYDSTQGTYTGVHGSNVSMGTNATANGAINLSGGVIDYGNAYVGPGGDPARVITTSGGSVIYGTRGSLNSPRDMTPKSDPGGGAQTTFTNGTTLTSGTYRVSSISLSGSGKGTINGNVTLYVNGSLTLSGSSQIGDVARQFADHLCEGQPERQRRVDRQPDSKSARSDHLRHFDLYDSDVFRKQRSLRGYLRSSSSNDESLEPELFMEEWSGKSVSISGGATVHYDESLGNIGN